MFSIVITLIAVIFMLSQNKNEEDQNMAESGETKNRELEDIQIVDKEFSAEEKGWEANIKEDKIELMNYIELPLEDFIKETGLSLKPDQESKNVWKTENNVIRVSTKQDRIIGLSISQLVGDEEIKQLILTEGFPYTIAGISLNDEISHLEKDLLKDASYVSGGSGYSCYTSLDLSKMGIDVLTLINMGKVDGIYVNFDFSLKKNAEELEYIWEEKIYQKEGVQNNQLKIVEKPCGEIPEYNKQLRNIDKTIIWIRYPHIEISGRPEMTQNINNLILETVEKIEDKTYRRTDENVVVKADYMITYMTSKFVSITFRVYVTGNDVERTPWQYCNINMEKNGEKAVLSDIGLTREEISEACDSSWYPVDKESYMEEYDTNWNHYRITPVKCILYVKPLPEDKELSDAKDSIPIEIFRI